MTPEEFDTFLTQISDCFVNRDFNAWAARVRLPLSLITQDGPVTLDTREALAENFENYLLSHRIMKLDMIARRPISIERCDDLTVIGTYETELLSNGKRLHAPYTSSALLHRGDSGWQMSSIMNALGHHPWTGIHPYLTGDKT